MLIRLELVILHHVQQKITPFQECCLELPLWKYSHVGILFISALLCIPIYLMKFVPLSLIKFASCLELVPLATVVDTEP